MIPFGFDEQYAMFDMTPVANQFLLEYMPMAKGEYVKVYLYGLMQCHHPQADMSIEQMSRDLAMGEEEILAAYRYWERKGLVHRISDKPPVFRYVHVNKLVFMDGAAPVDTEYEAFAEALYALFGNGRRLHGKEVSLCYEWVEELGLPQEVVLKLVAHMITIRGKKFSISSAQALAVELAEAKARTAEDAEIVLTRDKKVLEGSRAVLRQFSQFREPTQAEMALYRKWMAEWGFAPEAIEAACADTTNGKPTFKYLDGILKNLRARTGAMTTGRQVEKEREARRQQTEPLKELLRNLSIPATAVNDNTMAVYADMRALYPDEVILLAGQQCGRRGGKLDDVMNMLISWKEKGLQSADEVRGYIRQFEEQTRFLQSLYQLWNRDGRPTAADRTLLRKWQEDWAFVPEMIVASASYAAGAEKPMPYLDKLLENFRQRGIATPEAAAAAHQAWQEQQGAAQAKLAKPAKVVREQQYTQRDYEDSDDMPEWMRQRWKEMNGGA